VYHDIPVLDVHGHVSVPFGANSFLMLMMGFIPTDHHLAQKDLSNNLFGSEAPGSGRAVRPETGLTSDDLVPVIGAFDFLSEGDKIKIFHENPVRVIPALGKIR
jgi:hypothetical protein